MLTSLQSVVCPGVSHIALGGKGEGAGGGLEWVCFSTSADRFVGENCKYLNVPSSGPALGPATVKSRIIGGAMSDGCSPPDWSGQANPTAVTDAGLHDGDRPTECHARFITMSH